MGIYGGLGSQVLTREVSTNGSNEYLVKRRDAEEELEIMQFGLSFNVQTKSNFTARIGVEYNRLASRFSADTKQTVNDTIPNAVVSMTINEQTNDTIRTIGNVIITKTTTYTKETFNYFHLIDIPLLIGYEFNYDNWSIGLEAGVIANLSLTSKGDIFQPNGDYYNLKEDPEEWIKNSIGIAPVIHLRFAYKLGEQFQVFTSPFYRFKSVYSTDNNPLKQNYSTFGVQGGVRFMF